MLEWLLWVVVVVGLGARTIMVIAQCGHLRGAPLAPANPPPPVSILKPVKGLDAGLTANLESVFELEYPAFEVIIGAQRADDPALEVARQVAARYPHVPCAVIADPREVGLNPKVANLANLLRHARWDHLLISDSNVRVKRGYLADLVGHLQQPGVGLVSSPIRGSGGGSLGGAIDAFLLNTFVMGGTCALHRVFGGVCVVGKSMLLRRATLQELGGFEFLAQFLAEDQVCGQEVVRHGHRLALSYQAIDNVTGAASLRQVAARYLRWAKIRRRISPPGFAGEILLNPVAVATVGLAALRSEAALVAMLVAWTVATVVGWFAEATVGVRRSWPARFGLTLLADLLGAAVWPVALVARTVAWRGKTLVIGPRTRLSLPDDGEVLPELSEVAERT